MVPKKDIYNHKQLTYSMNSITQLKQNFSTVTIFSKEIVNHTTSFPCYITYSFICFEQMKNRILITNVLLFQIVDWF